MSKVIGLVQVKGGAGRSTVVTNIAGELAKSHTVAIVDCDMPQGTSASWAMLRRESKPHSRIAIKTATDHKSLVATVKELTGQVDYIILDAPPRIAEMTRAILVLSDLCIVPVGSSAAEVWATSDMLPLINEAAALKPVNVRLLWTRFRAYTRIAQELSKEAQKALGLKPLKTTLGFRVAYAEALGQGLIAGELHDQNARTETEALTTEIKRILR